MRSESLLIYGSVALVLSVVCTIGLNLSHTPISNVTTFLAVALPFVGAILAGRSQVYAKDTTEGLVKDALRAVPPASENQVEAKAKEMLK